MFFLRGWLLVDLLSLLLVRTPICEYEALAHEARTKIMLKPCFEWISKPFLDR